MLLATPAAAQAEEQAVVTSRWRPSDASGSTHLGWDLLDVPARVVHLVFVALLPPLYVAEQYRLPRRFYDFISNRERTFFVLPFLDLVENNGLSLGLSLRHTNLAGHGERFIVAGSLDTNLDYRVGATYRQALRSIGGRELALRVRYGTDRNSRYFGIGGDSTEEDERALAIDDLSVAASLQLLPLRLGVLQSWLTLSFRREGLGPGSDDDLEPLHEDDPRVRPPPGFDRTLDFPALTLTARYDSRNRPGKTSEGLLVEGALGLAHDLEYAHLSAVTTSAEVTVFVPLLPPYRVLAVNAGIAASTPWSVADELPLDSFITLGRTTHLRGYPMGRFRDRAAWWTSLEYRYPFLELIEWDPALELLAVLFAEMGRAGSRAEELWAKPPRWSAGFGLRAEGAKGLLLGLQFGFSNEGVEYILSAGAAL